MSGVYVVACDHKKIRMEEITNIGLKLAYNFNILFYICIYLGFLKLSKGGIFFSHCK